MKRIGAGLAALLTATLGIVALPQTEAAAEVDVYTTPGIHLLNGREWRTSCEPYSSTVDRCRAEIKATVVKVEAGQFVEVTDWAFNNLTYKPSPRSNWKGNPLGEAGDYVIDGRQWRTECDTAQTGNNACRSYILTTVYGVKTMTPRTYEQSNQWVFNNIVRFSVAPPPTVPPKPTFCNAAPLPAGFALTDTGRPYVIKAPYTPVDMYNPTSISNFIRNTSRASNDATTAKAREDQKCLALLAAGHLMNGSETTRNAAGEIVRWFPYMFRFSANPTTDDLTAPWHSGLAQGGVLTTFTLLTDLTGDRSWLTRGAETFRSFEVPVSEPGGILNRDTEHGFLWFEEYPTTKNGQPLPTTVLNGHLEALIGLNLWHRRMVAEQSAGRTPVSQPAEIKALVDEALSTLEPMLNVHEVDIDGGTLTSYDAVRGYPAAPLRVNGPSTLKVTSAALNNKAVTLPRTSDTWDRDAYLVNGTFATVKDGMPEGWTRLGSSTYSGPTGGYYRIRSGGNAWQGLEFGWAENPDKGIPSSWLQDVAGKPMTLTMRASISYPSGKAGASGRIALYEQCGADVKLHYENVLRGSGQWADYTFGFNAPKAGCNLRVQFMVSPYNRDDTVFLLDDVQLSSQQTIGSSLKPAYDLKVYRTPENILSLTGSGRATVQAHYNGRWQDFATVDLTAERVDIVIPERFTGRNIHLGYHETHVGELMALYRAFPQHGYLLEYAQRWAPMAPSVHHTVPKPTTTTSRVGTSTMSIESVIDEAYEYPLVDQFTGLPYEELEMLDELAKPAK
ncbi:D-glucuronyl C5-epimerase family protein [Tessaracoccus sp. ZS01]|uniref:D-glucuronyl C5-epimerase family protein n=1 Tax=Tessaracoccus sp. ZS01 TaxID=1906324 RepID=UPI00096EC823|nr:D-glucuronyl C5-epimerase family protein [Tessaracoccus sp. ZS01]OMG58861.1 hypothetical protein BJN44_01970 [Tessaracoccus sp. ZS01]